MKTTWSALGALAVLLAPVAGAHDHPAQSEAAAIGSPGKASEVRRTIEISMTDRMRFEPAEIRVKAGETVRIVARNRGATDHELVLGTQRDLEEHAAMMRMMPGMEHHDPNMVRVKPGGRGTIVWRFTTPGEVRYGCLVPGHFEAGMVGKVIVAPK